MAVLGKDAVYNLHPIKMRLPRSAELVGAKPLHLLTQTALPLKSPTGAFIAAQTRIFPGCIFTEGVVKKNDSYNKKGRICLTNTPGMIILKTEKVLPGNGQLPYPRQSEKIGRLSLATVAVNLFCFACSQCTVKLLT